MKPVVIGRGAVEARLGGGRSLSNSETSPAKRHKLGTFAAFHLRCSSGGRANAGAATRRYASSRRRLESVIALDDACKRKPSKKRSVGRIDGLVALALAIGVAPLQATPIDVEALIGDGGSDGDLWYAETKHRDRGKRHCSKGRNQSETGCIARIPAENRIVKVLDGRAVGVILLGRKRAKTKRAGDEL
jgi:hypothetical protein